MGESSIKINGIEFINNPLCKYKHDYTLFVNTINDPSRWHEVGNIPEGTTKETMEKSLMRHLVLNDLWFIIFFVMGIPTANHPFVVEMCKRVEREAKTKTLDIWARFHWKSTAITIAETVQYHLKHPEECSCIFSYKKPAAEDFLDSVRKTYEKPFIKYLFSEIVYENPVSQSPSWSLQNGVTLKRNNTARKEATIEASGLVEGMLTGKHFERRIYDDVETADMANSPDVMNDCFSKFEMSSYLGTGNDSDIERVIGTFYNHSGPLVRIRDKQKVDKSPVYYLRVVPGTDDGTPDGKPVLMSQARLEEERLKDHFNSQILCDPTPSKLRALKSETLVEIDPHNIPKNIIKFMVVDPAGDNSNNKKGDSWSIMVIGIDAAEVDELGGANIYITNALISPLGKAAAIEEVARMYMVSGVINAIGVEKQPGAVNYLDTQIKEVLEARGRRVSVDDKSLVLLPTGGRNKKEKIQNALAWRFSNSKIHISKNVPVAYRDRIKQEMDKFPHWHDDGLDGIAYFYDLIKDVDMSAYTVQQYHYAPKPYRLATVAG